MKTPWVLALAFALGVAGVLAGHALRDRVTGADAGTMPRQLPAPETALEAGTPFPAIAVVDETGRRRLSSQLFGSEGGVVLFLELECPPCVETARRWQGIVDAAGVDPARVAGITMQPTSAIAAFRAEHDLEFEILQDDTRRFMSDYRVSHFPMEVVVDGAGIVQQIGRDLEVQELP